MYISFVLESAAANNVVESAEQISEKRKYKLSTGSDSLWLLYISFVLESAAADNVVESAGQISEKRKY